MLSALAQFSRYRTLSMNVTEQPVIEHHITKRNNTGRNNTGRNNTGRNNTERHINERLIAEHHDAPNHYLFNNELVSEDPSLFDQIPASVVSNNNGRGTVYFRSLPTQAGNCNVVVKQYRRGGMVRHFNKNLYWHGHHSQSRAWLEFKLLIKMTAMGLPVPTPVAARAKRTFLHLYESTIITQEIEQSKTLADCLKQHPDQPVDHTLWQNTGETIKRFHTANIYHADLNASNILIGGNDQVYLIDFDKGQLLPDNRTNWKRDNLHRLQRSLLKYQRNNDQFQYSTEHWNSLLAGYER